MSSAIKSSAQATTGVARPGNHHLKLRHILPAIFFLLISVVALLILMITRHSVTTSIETLAEVVMTRVSQRVMDNTRHYLEEAANIVQINATTLPNDPAASPEEHQAFLQTFAKTSRKQLQLFPHFGLIYQGDQHGNHWLNKREHDDTIHMRVVHRKDDSAASKAVFQTYSKHARSTKQDRASIAAAIAPYMETRWYEQDKQGKFIAGEYDPIKLYDPRTRPWYQGAQQQKRLFWTDVYGWEEKYQGTTSRQVGITVSAPIIHAEQMVGVAGIDISLQAVSQFLRNMKIMKNGQAFILNSKGETVGLADYPDVLQKADSNSNTVALNHVSAISNQTITASYAAISRLLGKDKLQPLKLQGGHSVSFYVGNQRFYGFYKPFASKFGLDWQVGVVVPEDDFLGNVKQELQRSLIVVLASIFFIILAGIVIGRMITKPLHTLGGEVERIIQFDLAPTPPLQTWFFELSMISYAFTRMKLELAKMVDTIFTHSKTLEWSAEEFSNTAVTMEDSSNTMSEHVKSAKNALQNLPEQANRQEAMAAISQIETTLNAFRSLSQPVLERAQKVTQTAYALRQALNSFRI